MRIAFITRSTIYIDPGGDTIQITQTAKHLEKLGVTVDIIKTTESINYSSYDILHFFNLTRPADILCHITKSKKPFVISPILVNYLEYDKHYRKGLSGLLLKYIHAEKAEYIKTIARWLTGKDVLQTKSYLWKGHAKSIKEILQKSSYIIPNSEAEYREMVRLYQIEKPYSIAYNGVDTTLFFQNTNDEKDSKLVLCVGRIEGRKNQINVIKALNDSVYILIIIGSAAHNQKKYYDSCKKIASQNIVFIDQMSQKSLINYYKKAKVHILASWFETCGLSSMEAAAMGCNIVITDKGFTRDYYGDHAFYCDPNDPNSILNAIEEAAKSDPPTLLQNTIATKYTWQQAALATQEAYKRILSV